MPERQKNFFGIDKLVLQGVAGAFALLTLKVSKTGFAENLHKYFSLNYQSNCDVEFEKMKQPYNDK
jgi:hypothetical protein